MSTKIFHGYKKDNFSLNDLHAKLKELKPNVELVTELLGIQAILKKAISNFLKEEEIDCYLVDAWLKLSTMFRFSFSFSIVDNNYLFIYTGISVFENMFKEKLELEEYQYFNNLDKPEEISDEEWESRSENWNKLFQDNLIFEYEYKPLLEFPNEESFDTYIKQNKIKDVSWKDIYEVRKKDRNNKVSN